MPELQVVDPAVSRAKFDREIADFKLIEESYRRRGIFLLDHIFPEVFVIFASTGLKPAAITCATVIDFTNYDLDPPGVKFVNPFTRQPLKSSEMSYAMLRATPPAGLPPEVVAVMRQQGSMTYAAMLQTNGPDEPPFLCLPGVREYHENPAHTGDSWLLHRGSGEGSLAFILDKIWTYGVNPIDQYQVQVNVLGIAVNQQRIPQ